MTKNINYEATTDTGVKEYTLTLNCNEHILKYGYINNELMVEQHTVTGLHYGDKVKL